MKNPKLLMVLTLAKVCSGATMAACLKQYKDQVSNACKSAVKARHGRHKGAPSGDASGDSQDQ